MVVPFLGTYLAVVALNLVGALLFLFLDIPKPPEPAHDAPHGAQPLGTDQDPAHRRGGDLCDGVLCADEPRDDLDPAGGGRLRLSEGNAADIVTGHVLAMFLPSFFTGHLIARFGVEKVIARGC